MAFSIPAVIFSADGEAKIRNLTEFFVTCRELKNNRAMKWLHNLLKGLSLTAALFVFQACYGTPPGYPDDFDVPMEEAAEPAPAPSEAEAELPEVEFPQPGTPE